jgi:hypothetical protein
MAYERLARFLKNFDCFPRRGDFKQEEGAALCTDTPSPEAQLTLRKWSTGCASYYYGCVRASWKFSSAIGGGTKLLASAHSPMAQLRLRIAEHGLA